MIYWVTSLSMKIHGPRKAKGVFLGDESENEILNDLIKSCDTCTKLGLFAQMAWI